jgi:hypothetical protein
MNESYLKIIYSGSVVNAQYIAGLLEEAGVECVINDEFQTSLMAGWAAPGSENSVKVMVAKENIDRAVQLIKAAKDSK